MTHGHAIQNAHSCVRGFFFLNFEKAAYTPTSPDGCGVGFAGDLDNLRPVPPTRVLSITLQQPELPQGWMMSSDSTWSLLPV